MSSEEIQRWQRLQAERNRRDSERKTRLASEARAAELLREVESLETEQDQLTLSLEKSGTLDRADKRTYGWWALGWIPASAVWFVGAFFLDHAGVIDMNANATVGVLIVVLLPVLFWLPPLIRATRRRSAATQRLRTVRTSIDDARNEIAKLTPRRRHDETALTTRQAQHAWYGTHSELNWRHREQGQALGFDNAHDYVNNFLESE